MITSTHFFIGEINEVSPTYWTGSLQPALQDSLGNLTKSAIFFSSLLIIVSTSVGVSKFDSVPPPPMWDSPLYVVNTIS